MRVRVRDMIFRSSINNDSDKTVTATTTTTTTSTIRKSRSTVTAKLTTTIPQQQQYSDSQCKQDYNDNTLTTTIASSIPAAADEILTAPLEIPVSDLTRFPAETAVLSMRDTTLPLCPV